MGRVRSFLPLAASLLVACSSEEGPSANDEPTVTATAGIALSASAEPLRSFHYDTGLVPAGSPAQVELSLSAGGGVRVEAHGKVSDKGLEGEAGSGKMTLDLHLKLDGRLKTDATLGALHVGGAGEGELRR